MDGEILQGVTALKELNFQSRWCHSMDTFSLLLALCEGNPPITSRLLPQRTSNAGFDAYFDVSLNYPVEQTIELPVNEMPWHSCDFTVIYHDLLFKLDLSDYEMCQNTYAGVIQCLI